MDSFGGNEKKKQNKNPNVTLLTLHLCLCLDITVYNLFMQGVRLEGVHSQICVCR